MEEEAGEGEGGEGREVQGEAWKEAAQKPRMQRHGSVSAPCTDKSHFT